MTVAKRRAIDWLRRSRLLARKHEELGRALEIQQDMTAAEDDAIADADDAVVGDDTPAPHVHRLSSGALFRGALLLSRCACSEA